MPCADATLAARVDGLVASVVAAALVLAFNGERPCCRGTLAEGDVPGPTDPADFNPDVLVSIVP